MNRKKSVGRKKFFLAENNLKKRDRQKSWLFFRHGIIVGSGRYSPFAGF